MISCGSIFHCHRDHRPASASVKPQDFEGATPSVSSTQSGHGAPGLEGSALIVLAAPSRRAPKKLIQQRKSGPEMAQTTFFRRVIKLDFQRRDLGFSLYLYAILGLVPEEGFEPPTKGL
jgi:hypothetical protein